MLLGVCDGVLVADGLGVTPGPVVLVGTALAVSTLVGGGIAAPVGAAGELSEEPHAARVLIINVPRQTQAVALNS